MSPEQIEGKEADARSDLFALGGVFYEMLTGSRPFEGKSQISVASAILEKEPESISKTQPLTPPAFEYLVTTCLAKNPDDRYQSAHDVMLQLKGIAQGGAPVLQATEKRENQRELLGWLVAGGLALLLIAFCSLVARVESPSRDQVLSPLHFPSPPGCRCFSQWPYRSHCWASGLRPK